MISDTESPTATGATPGTDRPLYVDLDGTLIASDLLWESVLELARSQPGALWRLPVWLAGGRAHLKQQLADRVEVDVATLPYRGEVRAYLEEQRRRGRRLVLATASEQRLAAAVASHLGLFDGVIATEGGSNRKGAAKLEAIRAECGDGGFDYLGDSAADLPLWRAAGQALAVDRGGGVVRRLQSECPAAQVVATSRTRPRSLLRALRPHQWAKNVLVFVPLVTAHRLFDPAALAVAVVAFLAFCVTASAVYLLNDLLDLPSDRVHPRKRLRPLAAGLVPIPTGLVLAALLLVLAIALALMLPPAFGWLLLLYMVLTTAYSAVLKRKLMVDVLCLAGLYTLRILAGGAATGTTISAWLAAFSMFFFLSLAFAKRYVELDAMERATGRIPGRGYQATDLEMVRTMGPASGYLSVLVFCSYIDSPAVLLLYTRPGLLWLVCPLLLYWISRLWFLAHRQELPHDPVVFALRDRHSYVVGLLVLGVMVAASL